VVLSKPHGRLAHQQAWLIQPKLHDVAGCCWGMLGHAGAWLKSGQTMSKIFDYLSN